MSFRFFVGAGRLDEYEPDVMDNETKDKLVAFFLRIKNGDTDEQSLIDETSKV